MQMQMTAFASRLEIIQSEKDFLDLKKCELVPPLVLAKLQFLLCLIQGEKVNENIIESLPYYQRQTLEQLSLDTQIKLFTSTIKCISGKEIQTHIRREKGFLLKEKGFFGWSKCYIDCNSKQFHLYQSRKSNIAMQKMSVSNLWISRFCKAHKKKTIFAIYHQNIKYVFGFDEQSACKSIHQTLTLLIRDNREWQCTKYSQMQASNNESTISLGPQFSQVQDAIHSQEIEYLSSIKQRLTKYNLSDNNLKLVKNIQHGRILYNQKQGSVKVSLTFKDIKQIVLVESYILQSLWNKNVQVSKILSKPRANSYICYMKTNRYNFISYPRDCFLSVVYYHPCQCRDQNGIIGNSYLIIQSIENESQPPQAGTIRMKFNQIIQISKSQQVQNMILMQIITEADFKGYSTLSDNAAMGIHLMDNLSEFIKIAQRNQKRSIFDQILCPCKGEQNRRSFDRVVSDFSVPTQRNFLSKQGFSQRQSFLKQSFNGNGNIKMSKNKQKMIQFVDLIPLLAQILRGNRRQQFLQVLKLQRHHSYALKHRFSDKDQSFCLYVGQNRQFLQQGNKWRFKDDNFQFINQEMLAVQNDILKMILKQLGSNLMSGKPVMNMSLPVEIFDKKSMLDIIAEGFGFLPYYLTKAAAQKDPIQQMKLVTCAFMFIPTTNPNIQKPFNPILGQTYQGRVGNFIINMQQISHHPSISSLYIRSQNIQIYGNFQISVDLGINTACSTIHNWLNLHISTNNTQYRIKPPDVEVKGLAYGARTLKLCHHGYVYEKNNNLFCEMAIGKGKKKIYESNKKLGHADLIGGIFRVKPSFGQKVLNHNQRKAFQGLRPEDVISECCLLSGKWYGNIFFNNVSYKSIRDGPFPQKCFKLKYLLPSDSIFREDIVFKLWKDNEGSNREKERLENIQRNDRKLREKYRKK